MNDQQYMRLALDLAQEGWGWTSPNPMAVSYTHLTLPTSDLV